MLEKKILLVLASLSLSALVGCSSGGGGGEDDLDIAEIQEIEQTGEFSEDEFFASEDVDNIDEEQLVEDVPGLEEDLEVSQEELEASGDEGFEVDLAEEEQDLFAESGLAENDLQEEGSIAQNNDISEDELDGLLEEDLGEEDFAFEGSEPNLEGENINDEQLALESEENLFRDLEEESTGETFSDNTNEPSASELLADEEMDYSSEATQNYQEPSSSDMIAEDINVDVDYSQAMAEDNSLDNVAAVETAPKSFIPVKKMKTVPYDKNGVLVNAIYFVREGDSLRSIADKVYGAGSAVDFTIVNPHLRSGNLRVGQKVYYNSPSRPQDRSRLLTYYEDARAPMMNYSAREGENIREISQSLLGHPRSWMEVWASNLQIESKAALEAPYQIRYWEGTTARPSAPVLAQTQPEPTMNQANLDMSEPDLGMDDLESDFSEPAQDIAASEQTFDSETLEEPIMEDDFTDELAEDLAAVGSVEEPPAGGGDTFDNNLAATDEGFDGEIVENDPMAAGADPNAEANPRNVALNNTGGGFPAQNQGGIAGLMNDPGQMGIVAGALLLLLGVGFIVIRRRKASAEEAIEMESFDFGGETVIEDEVNKTQVDI